jgi:hypothetical protein
MDRMFLRTHLTDREKLAIYILLADWKSYGPMLSENAIDILHDIGWEEGVQRDVMEANPVSSANADCPTCGGGG